VDILAFHIRGLAASGGDFKVASTGYIYNQLCTSRPDVIELLAKPDWKFEGYRSKYSRATDSILTVIQPWQALS
jgi:hypothetical protein